MSTRTRIGLTLMAFAALAFRAEARDCEWRIAASTNGHRTVVLAGGDAWSLFQQYMTEVKRRDLPVSLWNTTVRISRGGEVDVYELGWLERLSGESAKALWQRNLAGRHAALDQGLMAAAHEGGWDICTHPAPPPPPPPDTNPAKTSAAPAYDAVAFFKSGIQYAARRDYRNALQEFKAAERISPHFEGLAMNMGVAYMQLKDYANAAAYLKRAIDASPRSWEAHYNMACLQARLGQGDDAIASLNEAKRSGMKTTAQIHADADLSSLRGRTEFETLFK